MDSGSFTGSIDDIAASGGMAPLASGVEEEAICDFKLDGMFALSPVEACGDAAFCAGAVIGRDGAVTCVTGELGCTAAAGSAVPGVTCAPLPGTSPMLAGVGALIGLSPTCAGALSFCTAWP